MDQITAKKQEIRLQNWAKLVADCQNSQLTVRAWCEQQGICPKTYYYWLRKIRERAMENAPVPASTLPAKAETEKPITFKQLEVQSPVSGMQAAVIIRLPSATVEVAQGTDQQTVEAVLLALKAVC